MRRLESEFDGKSRQIVLSRQLRYVDFDQKLIREKIVKVCLHFR